MQEPILSNDVQQFELPPPVLKEILLTDEVRTSTFQSASLSCRGYRGLEVRLNVDEPVTPGTDTVQLRVHSGFLHGFKVAEAPTIAGQGGRGIVVYPGITEETINGEVRAESHVVPSDFFIEVFHSGTAQFKYDLSYRLRS